MRAKGIRTKLEGTRFGRLTVSGDYKKGKSHYLWRCICDCGGEKWVASGTLKAGHTKSCGCFRKEVTRNRSLTHGSSALRENPEFPKEYNAWTHAKGRCYNPNDRGFKNYGGRGIKMSEEWKNDFLSFLRHMGPAPQGMSLDRIDTNGDYEPGNCRWATRLVQNENKRTSVILPNGMCISNFCRTYGYSRRSFQSLFRGEPSKGKPPVSFEETLRRCPRTQITI